MMPDVIVKSDLQSAILLHQSGQLKQAAVVCKQVLKTDPENSDALHLLGLVFHQSGQLTIAVKLIKRALKVSPNQPDFLFSLADILRESGQFEEAVRVYKKVIEFKPASAEVYNSLGISLHKLNEFQFAIQAYYSAIKLDSTCGQTYSNLAMAFIKLKQFDKALDVCLKSIELSPDNVVSYCNLGSIYREQGKLEEAIQYYQYAISIQPNIPEIHSNLGQILEKSGKLNEAIAAYQKALDIDPEYAEIRRNLSVPCLMLGDFERGWEEYEWRWQCNDFIKENEREFPQPMWDNTTLSGRSIVIWLEQGVGDCIMFASLLCQLQKQAEQVLVETESRLLPLFQRSFPEIDFLLVQNPPHPCLLDSSIDFQSPIASLGQWLLLSEESFPKYCRYLVACPHKTQKFRHRFQQEAGEKLLVGISWSSLSSKDGMLKSTSLSQWKDLLSQKGCFFVNLQYGDIGAEINAFLSRTGILIYQDEEVDSLQSLDDFASQVAALDLVISIDNVTVHMAGALGKPVWVLLHYSPDWRWQLERSDTPWYPSMTLYRQPVLGGWDGVFQQVQPDLQKFVIQNRNTQNIDDA